MPEYRHACHAGNYADVLKHLLLVQTLKHLDRSDGPRCYVDTHAGAGLYALDAETATQESGFRTGIVRLWDKPDQVEALSNYLDLVRSLNPDGLLRRYPGSPWFARQLSGQTDRFLLFELNPADSRRLRLRFASTDDRVKIVTGDGFAGLDAFRSQLSCPLVVLLDPPYVQRSDYRLALDALRLSTPGKDVYLLWYPLLQRPETLQFSESLTRLAPSEWLHLHLTVRSPSHSGMFGCGLFILNPPPRLAERINPALPSLVNSLGQDESAGYFLNEG